MAPPSRRNEDEVSCPHCIMKMHCPRHCTPRGGNSIFRPGRTRDPATLDKLYKDLVETKLNRYSDQLVDANKSESFWKNFLKEKQLAEDKFAGRGRDLFPRRSSKRTRERSVSSTSSSSSSSSTSSCKKHKKRRRNCSRSSRRVGERERRRKRQLSPDTTSHLADSKIRSHRRKSRRHRSSSDDKDRRHDRRKAARKHRYYYHGRGDDDNKLSKHTTYHGSKGSQSRKSYDNYDDRSLNKSYYEG